MASTNTLTILEHVRISPPSATVNEKSIPLSIFDIGWQTLPPLHQLSFYDFPCPSSHFAQTLIPSLKHSLSLTLQHFFPLAGNLIIFPRTNNQIRNSVIRYTEGNSVSLTIAESTNDYSYFITNQPREADMFHPFVPQLDGITKNSDGSLVSPLLAIQITLFPNTGICIGITTHHAACDGNARVNFIRTWASICKSGNDKSYGLLPVHDRSLMKDPYGVEQIYWSRVKEIKIHESPLKNITEPTNKVRATFILSRAQIINLRNSILTKRPKITYISSFTIICGLIWSCMAKMRASNEDKDKGDNVLEQFHCAVDCRERLKPSIPAGYFGNCIVPCCTTTMTKELVGDEGFLNGVELIGEAIKKILSDEENIYLGLKMMYEGRIPFPPTMLGVTGSPKFNIYDVDFGWGKPQKCEFVSLDFSGSMSLSATRDSLEDLEIGLSIAKDNIESFVSIFNDVLLN